MYSLSPHQTVKQFLPLQRHTQVLVGGMDIPLGDLHRRVTHGGFNHEGAGSGFGETSAVGVPERIEDKLLRPVVGVSQPDMGGGETAGAHVLVFHSRKYPRLTQFKRGDVLKRKLSSCRLGKHALRIHRFSVVNTDRGFRDVGPFQGYCFRGPESEVQHQNGDFPERILGFRQVDHFQFAGEHEDAIHFTGKPSHFRNSGDQPRFFGQAERLPENSQVAVDGADRELVSQFRFFESLKCQLVNLIQGQGRKRSIEAQALDAVEIGQFRVFRLGVLLDVFRKRAFQKDAQDRGGIFGGDAERFKGELRSERREPQFSLFVISESSRTLMPNVAKAEVVIPILSSFKKSHA